MAFWDFLKRPVSHSVFEPNVTYLGSLNEALREALSVGPEGIKNLTPTEMFFCQPHLRTVVTFLARNIAQLGLHVFERDGDDRARDRASALAQILAYPNSDQTAYDLIFATVGDKALYDRAYWLIVPDADMSSGWSVRRLPPNWVSPVNKTLFSVGSYLVLNGQGDRVEVPPSQILAFTGYHPSKPTKGSPTVESLKDTLAEQIEAARYRGQVWKRGGRVSAVIQRPKDAAEWSNEARQRFTEDWYAKFTGNGSRAGGTPLLEDGMTLQRIDFNAQEQQFVEAAKLAFSTVASAFHVNPTMVGVLDNANYSNVREFRRMLYGDTLGPEIASMEARINTFGLRMLDMDPERYFAEFNIAEKLQGSFEEQNQAMQTAVGRPWMTADEARKVLNLPALGGDAAQLVTPLNVLVGGQASPTDSGSQNLSSEPKSIVPLTKARVNESFEKKHQQVVERFFKRQEAAVLSALGAKADADWWDSERWDKELADDLLKLNLNTSTEAAKSSLLSAGFTEDDYDQGRTLEFLSAIAARVAGQINTVTKDQLDTARRADDSGDATKDVFIKARTSRAAQIAVTTVTFASAFGLTESAKQVSPNRATKTWVVESSNPRPTHAAMNGQTVGIDQKFSNGADWPADGNLDVDEIAGCTCSVQVNY